MFFRYQLLLLCLLGTVGLTASPIAICQSNVNVSLPADACTVTITTDMLDGGSYDTNGLPVSLSVSGGTNLGPGTHTVRLITSVWGSTNSCWSTVLVEDKTTPSLTCHDQTYYLVAPDQEHIITVEDLYTLRDNCEPDLTISVPDIAGFGSGTFTVSATDRPTHVAVCFGTITYVNGEPQNYCSANRNSNYEHIARVQLGSASNTQTEYTGNDGGYRWHYPEGDNILYHGYDYTLSYAPGFRSGSYHEYWQVFIDKNGDGDFTDSGELLHQWNGYGGNSFTFTSPGAFWGWSRIRVVMSYGGYAPSCGGGWGEVEDISVYLRPWFILPWPWGWGQEVPTDQTLAASTPEFDLLPTDDRPSEAVRPGEAARRQPPADFSQVPPVTHVATEAIRLFPNPATAGGQISLTGPSSATNGLLVLRDLTGRQLATYPAQERGVKTDLLLPDNLPTGIYLLSGTTWSKRVLVK